MSWNYSPMTTIQLQRQGVSCTLRGRFLPCPHGHKWHVEFASYQGKHWLVDVSYPNCHECYGKVGPEPVWDEGGQASFNRWQKQHDEWRSSARAGQRAYTHTYHSLLNAKAQTARKIAKLTGEQCGFSADVEAYMCYTEHYSPKGETGNYPYLDSDVYITCATYEPETDTIRHEPSNRCLVAFGSGTDAVVAFDPGTEPYLPQINSAYTEFLKDHNQRMTKWGGPLYPKIWMAWLLGEYIKDQCPGETPVKVRRIERNSEKGAAA